MLVEMPDTVSTLQKVGKTLQTPVSKRHMPLIARVLLALSLAPIAFVAGLMLISILWFRAQHIPWLREKIIRHNKRATNPTTLKNAGGRSSVYGVVKHVGRRSGRAYTTPVVARPLGDGLVIPLPFGSSVDWCRNVLAAGMCTLTWKDQTHTLERPELIQQSQALKAFPFVMRVLYPAGGLKEYLWLHQHKEVFETVPVDTVPHPLSV